MKRLTSEMMSMLRQRRDLTPIDTSKDEEIKAMSPVEIVSECSAWEFGERSWADTFAGWMKAAGAKPEDFDTH